MNPKMEFTPADVLRLEVANTVNLVPNPSGLGGQFGGAWGWLTPGAGRSMGTSWDSSRYKERHASLVPSGQFSVGSDGRYTFVFDAGIIASTGVREGDLITVYGGAASGLDDASTFNVDEIPGGTTIVGTLLFGTPLAEGTYSPGAQLRFSTSGPSLLFTATPAGGTTSKDVYFTTTTMPIQPGLHADGRVLLAQLEAWTGSTLETPVMLEYGGTVHSTVVTARTSFQWYDAAGMLLSTSSEVTQAITSGAFPTANTLPRLNCPDAVAPANTAGFRLKVRFTYTDPIPVTTGTSTLTFRFSGAAAGTDAAVVESGVGLPPMVAEDPLDVFPHASSVRIEREQLGAGTMSVVLTGDSVDILNSDVLAVGKRVALKAESYRGQQQSTGWHPLFTGWIDTLSVTYPLVDGRRRIRVEMSAVDAAQRLASTLVGTGVRTIADLQTVIEDAGVPWDLNGFTGSTDVEANSGQSVLAYSNDNASLYDHVAIVRDTAQGYAFVDNFGAICVYEKTAPDGTGGWKGIGDAVDDPDYADTFTHARRFVVGESDFNMNAVPAFSSDRIINIVTVTALRLIGGETEEWTFGPYYDIGSMNKWGPRAANFTVATEPGSVLSDNAFQAYAQEVFDRSADAEAVYEELTFPILDIFDGLWLATCDLADMLEVTSSYAGMVDRPFRAQRIAHEITPRSWLMTVGLEEAVSAQPPTAAPALPTKTSTDTDGWADIPLASGWEAAETGTPQYRIKNGVVYLRGSVQQTSTGQVALNSSPGHSVGTLPVDARPIGGDIVTLVPPQNPANNQARLFVWTNGTLKVYLTGSGAAAYVSLYAVYPAGA
ncbi:MAG: hypothetical protein H5T76_14520 [Streptomyces sp.]|nr:hypothetical protein [Streptomyces sp.]